MKLFRASCLVAATLASLANSQSEPIVDLGYAQYLGVQNASLSVTSYFGIRYAQAPVGQLRFRAPVDIEDHNDHNPAAVIDATEQGPQCIQGTPGWQTTPTTPSPEPGSEDCLLLDVLVPEHPVSSSLPVMVQIHGGGYATRNSESYPGYALVNQSQGGLVYVSIQYRLNAFGFLSSTEVREDGSPNAGLLDQRAALGWVQRHIGAFGGDPSRVTISGNSAGGGSVMNQMILYGGEPDPPFRAAIAEYPWWQPYHNDTILEDQYRQVLTASGCVDLSCLRLLNATTLDLASQAAMVAGYSARPMDYGYGDFYYGPSVDGEIIRDLPSNEFKQGHFSKVALLVDRDGYEGYIFSNHSQTTPAQEVADLQTVFPFAKQSFFDRLYELYPAADFNSTVFQRAQIFGDFIIDCPTYYMATAVSDWGQPTYKMIFDAGSEVHGATVPFIFYTEASKINNATLAHIMKDYFLSFVTHLDPNAQTFTDIPKPYWPRYAAEGSGNFTVMDVNYTMMGVQRDFDASARCDFFHGQSYVVRN
ncbi:hypothetical protein MBLNU459_g4915t1 [Dothideomycetes sp. NU459]